MRLPLSASIVIGIMAGAIGVPSSSAGAATIIDEWGSVKAEPAPKLAPVTIDVKTTALIVMDLVKGSCNDQRRPRCVASIPEIAKLLNDARAKGMTVINTTAGSGPVADILPAVAPKPGEAVLSGTVADKFVRTDLEKILKDKGITTVIAVGTSAQGAILYTASGAALRGLKVLVPVDGLRISLRRTGRCLAIEPCTRSGAASDAHQDRYDQVLKSSRPIAPALFGSRPVQASHTSGARRGRAQDNCRTKARQPIRRSAAPASCPCVRSERACARLFRPADDLLATTGPQ